NISSLAHVVLQVLPAAGWWQIDFENTKEAYRSKKNLELLRSLFDLLCFCVLNVLLFQLMDLSRRVLGQRLFEKMMKMTFYGQFVAGEDHNSIKPLRSLILCYQTDLCQEQTKPKGQRSAQNVSIYFWLNIHSCSN
uniref:Proline dehydrogenase n=1 Tax=Periophthalmus magnuspinnatus TaxID=409849 RepID=A0A3B4ATU3_9GOBI